MRRRDHAVLPDSPWNLQGQRAYQRVRHTRLKKVTLSCFAAKTSFFKGEKDNTFFQTSLSLFCYFKKRTSYYRIYGVTSFIFMLLLHNRPSMQESANTIELKSAHDHNRRRQVRKRKALPENLAAKRGRILRHAC